LPAADLPLAAQLDALVARAEAGDPVAACRLLIDGARCAASSQKAKFANAIEETLIRDGGRGRDERALINVAAHSADAAETAADFCAGANDAALPKADDFLPAALPRLSVRQRVLLALTQEDGRVTRLPRGDGITTFSFSDQNITPQFFADNDLAFLQAGIAASDPLALEGMLLLHAPAPLAGVGQGPRLRVPDPRRFAHYGLLTRHLYGQTALGDRAGNLLTRVLARMSPEEQASVHSAVMLDAARWTSNASAASPDKIDTSRNTAELCDAT